MSNLLWQYIIMSILVGVAVLYFLYKLYLRFFSKKKYSPCDDCEGCALKGKYKEKKCPKSLHPPK